MQFKSVDHVKTALQAADYICSKTIATVVFLAQATQKPVLVEGPAGVGKTELSKAVARSLQRKLIRLQCYEGLDETKALYEWEYAKQLLYTQMVKEKIDDVKKGFGFIQPLIALQPDQLPVQAAGNGLGKLRFAHPGRSFHQDRLAGGLG